MSEASALICEAQACSVGNFITLPNSAKSHYSDCTTMVEQLMSSDIHAPSATLPSNIVPLHALQRRRLLEVPINLSTAIILSTLAVQTEKSTKIEFGCLQQLYFPDVNIL